MNYYIITLFAASAISVLVFFVVLKKKEAQGAMPLAVLLVSIFIWAFFQALVFCVDGFKEKLFFANLRYTGIESAALSFYALAREYEDKRRSFGMKKWILLSAFPVLCLGFLWTDQYHHLFYSRTVMENGYLNLVNGFIFYGNMAYLYVFIILGILIFIKAGIDKTSFYRKQAILLTVSATIPLIANVTFVLTDLWPYTTMDITPLTFLFSASLFFYGLFNVKLLDMVPIAKETLMENMEDFVIVLDPKWRILDLNKSARDFFYQVYRGPFEYVGRESKDFFTNWNLLLEAIYDPNVTTRKIVYTAQESSRYFHLRRNELHDQKGKISGYLVVLRDVTELEEALVEAQNAKEEAERANRAKDHFLANMSHEIRTPLNAVIGIAEALQGDKLESEKRKEYVSVILQSALSLLEILNDILDFSKIEAGKMELDRSAFNLRKMVVEMSQVFSITASGKSISLEIEIDEKLEEQLVGDPMRVRQVLTNLIGNAIKFTTEGSIKIRIRKIGTIESKSIIELSVSDTGIGISEESKRWIFDSFRQADSSTTRKFGGTGLGLSIVKNLVGLMGGEIRIESELGKGSTFVCEIPFELPTENTVMECDSQRIPQDVPGLCAENGRVMQILVAEDNKINQQVLRVQLDKLSVSVDFAETGRDAVEKAKNNKYDLILMDVMMPVLDGLEATREIREWEGEDHVPIVALTAGGMKEDISRCKEAGMDDHMTKPIRRERLYQVLEKYKK